MMGGTEALGAQEITQSEGSMEERSGRASLEPWGTLTFKATMEPSTLLSPLRMPRSRGASQPGELWRRRHQTRDVPTLRPLPASPTPALFSPACSGRGRAWGPLGALARHTGCWEEQESHSCLCLQKSPVSPPPEPPLTWEGRQGSGSDHSPFATTRPATADLLSSLEDLELSNRRLAGENAKLQRSVETAEEGSAHLTEEILALRRQLRRWLCPTLLPSFHNPSLTLCFSRLVTVTLHLSISSSPLSLFSLLVSVCSGLPVFPSGFRLALYSFQLSLTLHTSGFFFSLCSSCLISITVPLS